MRRDSSFCAKFARYNIFTNSAPQMQVQARRQDLAAGGPKTRRGGTFLKYSVGCM